MPKRESFDEKIDRAILEGGAGAYVRVRLPRREKGELFAIAEQLLGASKIRVVCAGSGLFLGQIYKTRSITIQYYGFYRQKGGVNFLPQQQS